MDEYGTVYGKNFNNPKIAFQTANKIIAMYERDEDLDYSELESMGFEQMN
jgi:cytochrome c peroxidase